MGLRIVHFLSVLCIAASVCWIALLPSFSPVVERLGGPAVVVGVIAILASFATLLVLRMIKVTPGQSTAPYRSTIVLIICAACALGLALSCHSQQAGLSSLIAGLFGPPRVQAVEAYDRHDSSPTVDHSTFDALLKKHVDDAGWIDYAGFAKSATELNQYLALLGDVPFAELDRDEKLALLINAYNAFTIKLILEHLPIDSIRDIPEKDRWDAVRWDVGGHTWSLNQIEHEQIRPKFKEPLIHFALVCAARSCPPLRNEAYVAARLTKQLAEQGRYAHTHERWLKVDASTGTVHLTELYNWYAGDFEQDDKSVLQFAAQYSRELSQLMEQERQLNIRWIPYSWDLNSVENRPEERDQRSG